ncbi:hypothetical protein SNOG_20113 [Parastagonospora nodorum SN15]|uniref:Uncharacterized protein n=1 Tax=Phaeosphaeria nodorum (strain SN15 / ATCC MYA-4574 / FGSC 10173) TaxID=321614 RepID=A9JXA9_PHANO|nr:hypothetical protein SNOG_20113 [Parastagonospora nodorum SN15]EDP89799.1 hypothetical protein SNOG_20113 [Parastagonospora nodorum SN15]
MLRDCATTNFYSPQRVGVDQMESLIFRIWDIVDWIVFAVSTCLGTTCLRTFVQARAAMARMREAAAGRFCATDHPWG